MRKVFLSIATTVVVFSVIWYTRGPQIDSSKVVTLDELAPMAMPCLTYYDPDHRGWPSSRDERAYIRFLQDHDCRIAFQPDEGRKHFALVGVMDGLKIRKLYEDARTSGIAVPKSPFLPSMAE